MANYVFGIDVGGTSVKCGLFQTDGTLLEKWEIPTRTENGGSEILPDIAKSVKAKMGEKGIAADDVAGVGIDVPGPVNDKGELSIAVNLNWGYKNIVKELSDELGGMAVKAANDANAAALGERALPDRPAICYSSFREVSDSLQWTVHSQYRWCHLAGEPPWCCPKSFGISGHILS